MPPVNLLPTLVDADWLICCPVFPVAGIREALRLVTLLAAAAFSVVQGNCVPLFPVVEHFMADARYCCLPGRWLLDLVYRDAM